MLNIIYLIITITLFLLSIAFTHISKKLPSELEQTRIFRQLTKFFLSLTIIAIFCLILNLLKISFFNNIIIPIILLLVLLFGSTAISFKLIATFKK